MNLSERIDNFLYNEFNNYIKDNKLLIPDYQYEVEFHKWMDLILDNKI